MKTAPKLLAISNVSSTSATSVAPSLAGNACAVSKNTRYVGALSSMLDNVEIDPQRVRHIEAIILSMTPEERKRPQILNGSRRARIALGSGRPVQEVNRLLKQFKEMRKMMKNMGKLAPLMQGGDPGDLGRLLG